MTTEQASAQLTTGDKDKIRRVFRYCDMRYFRRYELTVKYGNYEVTVTCPGTTSYERFHTCLNTRESVMAYGKAIEAYAVGYMQRKFAKLGRTDEIPPITFTVSDPGRQYMKA